VSGDVLDWPLLKRIMSLAGPFKKEFWASTFLSILLAILAPVRPYLIQLTVDQHIMTYDVSGLIFFTIILIVLLIVESILRYYFSYLTSWLGQSVIKQLRVDVFRHIVNLRLRFFDKTPIGTVTTRTINDVETINQVFSEGIITIIADILTILTVMGIMFYTDWRLTLVSLATFPFLIYGTYVFKEKIKDAFTSVRNQVARLNAFTQEHISGMRIIQIFNAEETEMKKFGEINAEHRQAHIDSILYYSIFFPVVEIISAVSIGLLVWYGSKSILSEQISPGVVVSFIMYINMLFRPIRELADKFNTLQMGMVGAERIFNVLDTDEQTEDKGSLQPQSLQGNIEFKNVWFAYNEENWVLKDISFQVKPGETLALVGATGAGKSSVINILNRFYEINKGSILVDGKDIRDYKLSYLRSHIATVLQDVFLFSDSIANNINLSNEEISRERLIQAAKEVGALEFIMKLPQGFDYDVMERGATLSAGQAQLISFIRAMVYDPRILVLDEATASVDTETEELIQHAINKLMQGRTSIVIAHRLSTIQNADKIIVLDHGEIKEMGSHQQLLKLNGFYRRLYDLQFNSEGIAKP
jgi:ATP-binding cassette subfamily B protein